MGSHGDDTHLEDGQDSPWQPYPRDWQSMPGNDEGDGGFTVVSYNVLTDGCIRGDQYDYCPQNIRYMKARHPRLIKELATLDGHVVCLQEVDNEHYTRMLRPDMVALGYQGVYLQREDNQGLALFYKQETFCLVSRDQKVLHDVIAEVVNNDVTADSVISDDVNDVTTNNDTKEHFNERQVKDTSISMAAMLESVKAPEAVLLVKLRHLASGRLISVANVHITWQELNRPALQTLQIWSSCLSLVKFAGGVDEAYVMCGDFNTPPDYPGYSLLTHGRVQLPEQGKQKDPLSEKEMKEEKTRTLIQHISGGISLPQKLHSAYNTVMGEEPAVTNCDATWNNTRCQLCLDYLWFSPHSLDVSGVLHTPSTESICRHYAIPSVLFPSDHIPLKARFTFSQTDTS